jgi:hypothetical protein
MEDVGIFYCHLVYFTVIWYILWLFGFLWSFGIFFPFWYVVSRKIWQSWSGLFTQSSIFVSRHVVWWLATKLEPFLSVCCMSHCVSHNTKISVYVNRPTCFGKRVASARIQIYLSAWVPHKQTNK